MPGSLVANIFDCFLQNKPLALSDLSIKRDFIFSMDIAKIIHHIILNKIYGTYDICSGLQTSLREIIKFIKSRRPAKVGG